MQCAYCGTKNDPKNKFCRECGSELRGGADQRPSGAFSELYGKEVDVLFFTETLNSKITGIVNPSPEQISRYRNGVLQRVTIESGGDNASDEETATLLTFIRQSKEYLGEKFDENAYRGFAPADLKKEYLHLFEKILKFKAKNPEEQKQAQAKTEKNKKGF
jgi:hypothetical protein